MNNREAVEALIRAAYNTSLVLYAGETQFAGWKDSHDSGAKVTFWLSESSELEPFRGMTSRKGKTAGQRVMIVAFEIGADEQPIPQSLVPFGLSANDGASLPGSSVPGGDKRPFGKYASDLYRLGWWFNPAVLEAIGTDAEYRAWIQKRDCEVCGESDWVEQMGEGRCEAAHVKRPSNAGMGMKPEYSCVPFCHKHHKLQHDIGLRAVYAVKRNDDNVNEESARQWLDNARDSLLVQWASHTLKSQLGYTSMALCPPDELAKWATDRGIDHTLPAIYKNST